MKNDEQLMCDAAAGDMDAFEEIVRRHQHGAFNVALGMLSDEHLAADAAQEAFLRVLEKADAYKPIAKFTTYFYSVLRRICIDYYRKKKPHLKPVFDDSESACEEPQDVLIRNENSSAIHKAVASLPARQRMALTLKHFQHMSYKEIATVMHCSPGAVDSLLARARTALKDALKDM